MIIRLLLLVLLGWLAYKVIRRYLAQPGAARPETTHDGDMVQCAHCGVHVPREEAIAYQGKSYCCQDHFNADQA